MTNFISVSHSGTPVGGVVVELFEVLSHRMVGGTGGIGGIVHPFTPTTASGGSWVGVTL